MVIQPLSTRSIKPNFCSTLPPTQYTSFFLETRTTFLYANSLVPLCFINFPCTFEFLAVAFTIKGHQVTNLKAKNLLERLSILLVMYKDCLKGCFYHLEEFAVLGYLGLNLKYPKILGNEILSVTF